MAPATCSGAACWIPELPVDHPASLFLVGGEDLVVPPASAYDYADALERQGTDARVLEDPDAGHEWIEAAPEAIVAWFEAHP